VTGTDARWRLEDERQFLRRSLDDAAREHAAGDLSDDDYAVLCHRDEERLAAVEEAIAAAAAAEAAAAEEAVVPVTTEAGAAGEAASPEAGADGAAAGGTGWRRRLGRYRWWLAALGVVSVVAAAVILASSLTSTRLPGETVTGGIDLNVAQQIERQLTQARTLVRAGKASEALEVYGDVLSEDPKQPVALAEWGWLDWEAASKVGETTVAAEGASALEEAVKDDPSLYAAQYYLGTVLVQEGLPKAAVAHFARFLHDRPTTSWLKEAAPEIRVAYRDAHQPVPAGVPTT
jgi:tetratricopeptide (TPR) repeat protein